MIYNAGRFAGITKTAREWDLHDDEEMMEYAASRSLLRGAADGVAGVVPVLSGVHLLASPIPLAAAIAPWMIGAGALTGSSAVRLQRQQLEDKLLESDDPIAKAKAKKKYLDAEKAQRGQAQKGYGIAGGIGGGLLATQGVPALADRATEYLERSGPLVGRRGKPGLIYAHPSRAKRMLHKAVSPVRHLRRLAPYALLGGGLTGYLYGKHRQDNVGQEINRTNRDLMRRAKEEAEKGSE